MDLKSDIEVENTRAKIKILQERYEASQQEPTENEYVKQLSLCSLKRMINQMTEEIVRYESRKNCPAPTRR
jgi:hypothetical protein